MIRLDRFQCWQFSSVHTLVCFDPSRSSLLFGLPANSFLDQPLAQLPQGCGRRFALRLLRRQAAAAVVEVHPSQALQLCSRGAVHSCGRSLLLEFEKEQEKKNEKETKPPTIWIQIKIDILSLPFWLQSFETLSYESISGNHWGWQGNLPGNKAETLLKVLPACLLGI